MRARHRIGKFLLRREIYYSGRGRSWTREHRSWLASLRLGDRASELTSPTTCTPTTSCSRAATRWIARSTKIATVSPWAEIIGRLRCPHGIDTLSAFGICAEVCDFERFLKPTAFSAYLGLVPSEHTSGDKRRQGAITKAGSAHARRLLTEAAHHYARPPRIGGALQRRQDGHEPWVIDLSWRAQRRLHGNRTRFDRRTSASTANGGEIS